MLRSSVPSISPREKDPHVVEIDRGLEGLSEAAAVAMYDPAVDMVVLGGLSKRQNERLSEKYRYGLGETYVDETPAKVYARKLIRRYTRELDAVTRIFWENTGIDDLPLTYTSDIFSVKGFGADTPIHKDRPAWMRIEGDPP